MRLERLAEADVDRLEAGRRVQPESCRNLGRHVDLGVPQPVRRRATAPPPARRRRSPRAAGRAGTPRRRAGGSPARRGRRAAPTRTPPASANECPARWASRWISAGGRHPSKWRWQSARTPRGRRVGGGEDSGESGFSGFSGFTGARPGFRIDEAQLYAPDANAGLLSRRSRLRPRRRRGRPGSDVRHLALLARAHSPRFPGSGRRAASAAVAAFLLRDRRGGRARRWLALEARRPDGRPPGAWGSIRRNLPAPRALLEPLRRLAHPSRRRGSPALGPAHGNPYLAVHMRVGGASDAGGPVR